MAPGEVALDPLGDRGGLAQLRQGTPDHRLCPCGERRGFPSPPIAEGPLTQRPARDAVGGEQLGGWVALSGERVLAGALRADAPALDSGAAYLFERDATGQWQEVGKLTASDGAPRSNFGNCVALDGDRVVVSAPFADGAFLDTGAIYIFERSRRHLVPR